MNWHSRKHPVETQWHYHILTRYGFEAITKEGVGFCRSYKYRHTNGCTIECATGIHDDYWIVNGDGKTHSWKVLESYLVSMFGEKQ